METRRDSTPCPRQRAGRPASPGAGPRRGSLRAVCLFLAAAFAGAWFAAAPGWAAGAQPAAAEAAEVPEPGGGSSGLLVLPPDGEGEPLSLPLRHTRVDAEVSGIVATVRVTQEFGNPFDRPIEAVYVFPLPQHAAVYAMRMTIGERTVEGRIRLREEARDLYEQARRQGRTASLLDQERPNVFTQSVANILPGDDIRVEISYFQDLVFDQGRYEFVFPMVVGPRYLPGLDTGRSGSGWSEDTDRVPDASRISPPLLPPGTRSGHDIELRVDLDTGVPYRDLETPSHRIRVDRLGTSRARVALSPEDRIPNKDFILRWRAGGAGPLPGWLAHRDRHGGTFLLLLQPEVDLQRAEIAPREYVFVIDTSGSMHGFPLEQCKRVVRRCLEDLRPVDRFRVILFAGAAETLSPSPLDATPENVRRALAYVDAARGGGGTEFLPALREALAASADDGRARIVLFLSDGYIGYEAQVLEYMHRHLGSASVFPLGVGSSVNRFLVDAMARIGRGERFVLTPNEDPEPVVNRLFELVSRPCLTGIEVDFEGIEVSDLRPAELPDLFAGRPLSLVGRYERGGAGRVVLSGRLAGRPWRQVLPVNLPEEPSENPGLACLWARRSIESLSDGQAIGLIPGDEARRRITDLALRFGLMSAYTSFVAVDSEIRNLQGEPQPIAVPVPLPDQVSPLAAPPHAYAAQTKGSRLRGGLGVWAGNDLLREQAAPGVGKPERTEERSAAADASEPDASRRGDRGAGCQVRGIRVAGTLGEAEAREVIEKALGKWRRDKGLRDLLGAVTIALEIAEDGRVLRARVLEEGGALSRAHKRLAALAADLRFPGSGARSTVQVELLFP